MPRVHLQHLSIDEIRIILDELERAMTAHDSWIKDWHRILICRLPIDDEYLSQDTHQTCGFGEWYYTQTHPGLRNHPDFMAIEATHRKMHAQARKLARKTRQGKRLSNDDYLAFVEQEYSLSQELIALKESFHEFLAMFDHLTGVYNRQAMFPILAQEHARVLRTGQPCSIAIVDLDHFKRINDTYGHQIGDLVLQCTAQYFADNLRPYDWFCRYGGEEFLVCLPNTSVDTAQTILDRFRSGLAESPITCDDAVLIKITVSVGVAAMSADVSLKETIARADCAMYTAKRAGRNRLCTWEDTGDFKAL
ncbi:MAG: diguanylate cyclase [bacterium]|nr:diguanylate cyclase [bacterium]